MAELRIKALVLRQHGIELFSFVLNSTMLRSISYVVPREKDTPEAIQRSLDLSRVRAIGEYIRDETSLLPNAIVVNLTEAVRIEKTEDGKEAIIVCQVGEGTDQAKSAYVLDGQHRIQGFGEAGGVEFDMPVVAIYNAAPNIMGKIFTDINSKQRPPSKVHLLAVRYQIGELGQEENSAMEVVVHLNEDPDSPFRNKVKMLDDDKGTWVSNEGMKSWVLPHVGNGGVLINKTTLQQGQIFKNYFNAIRQIWGEAWGSKEHVLSKAMGIEIMTAILREVVHRCNLNEARQLTEDAFKRQLSVLKDSEVELMKDFSVPLDWKSETFGKFTNRAAKSYIRKMLVNILQAADECGEVAVAATPD